MKSLAIAIMAAGKGTRMKSDLAKVLHPVQGRSMIHHVIAQARSLNPGKIICIIGHQRDKVREELADEGVEFVVQDPQNGTGHAVQQTAGLLSDFIGDVLVLSGDVPLLTPETLQSLARKHREQNADITVLTALFDDPFGYGRMIRNGDGVVIRIVEQKDAMPEELEVREINSGIYLFDAGVLFDRLHQLRPENAQGEYYLTDVVKMAADDGLRVLTHIANDPAEIQGINTLEQLAEADRVLGAR